MCGDFSMVRYEGGKADECLNQISNPMNTGTDFHLVSYELHKKCFEDDGPGNTHYDTWFDDTTVDYWRHMRMMEPAYPLLEWKKWLTVGDGRWGLDSIRLKKVNPSISILPTDLSENLLRKSHGRGLIEDYSVENAESLSFNDNEFDVALCKESFHHFPRPFLALYEMLRVSRKAVVLVEPNDQLPRPPVRRILESLLIKFKLRKPHVDSNFEKIGNYVYTISKRELQKAATAIQLPLVAFHEFDDHYIDGVEFEKRADNGPLQKRIKRFLWLGKWKARLGLRRQSHMVAILFKVMPSDDMICKLKGGGFTVVPIPKNPYLK